MSEVVCFACTTPYQILEAVSIVHHNCYDADIYIFDTFVGCNTISKNLEKEELFRHVYMIPFYESIKLEKSKWINRLTCWQRFVFAQRYIRHSIGKIELYNRFFSSSKAIPKMVLKRALEKNNQDMETVIYEDGMGTYFPEGHALQGSSLFQRLEKICHFEFAPNGKTIFMPCYPEIAIPPEGLTSFKWAKMPEIDKKESFREMVYRIFGYNNESIENIGEKCIIFDGYRSAKTEFTNQLDQIYDCIAKVFPGNIICKPHPRSSALIEANIKLYEDTKIPMEILYMERKSLQDKVLISYYSTAVFTPKLLFSEEPTIILLYRLLENNDVAEMDRVVERIGKIYHKTIMVPGNLQELKECLEAVNYAQS